MNFRKRMHLSKLSCFDFSSAIVSGESLCFWKSDFVLLQGCSNYFCVSKMYTCCSFFGTDFLYTLCNGGLPCGLFCPIFKVSASKCIFSYAPKISKDLLVIRIPWSPDILDSPPSFQWICEESNDTLIFGWLIDCTEISGEGMSRSHSLLSLIHAPC